jgi:hypothetical protein
MKNTGAEAPVFFVLADFIGLKARASSHALISSA